MSLSKKNNCCTIIADNRTVLFCSYYDMEFITHHYNLIKLDNVLIVYITKIVYDIYYYHKYW